MPDGFPLLLNIAFVEGLSYFRIRMIRLHTQTLNVDRLLAMTDVVCRTQVAADLAAMVGALAKRVAAGMTLCVAEPSIPDSLIVFELSPDFGVALLFLVPAQLSGIPLNGEREEELEEIIELLLRTPINNHSIQFSILFPWIQLDRFPLELLLPQNSHAIIPAQAEHNLGADMMLICY